MAKSSSCALLLAAAAMAAAQQTASVSGTVTNSVSNAPIVRAHVILQDRGHRFGALTDGEGKYSIAGIAPGTYMVSAERLGFVAAPDRSSGDPLELHAGDEKTSVDRKLTPQGAISGRVLDSDGEPVQSAFVSVEGAGGMMQSDTTDNKGRFRIGGLNSGKYRVKASLNEPHDPPEIRTDGSRQVHYIGTYFPGVRTRSEAARVKVEPAGETGGIDIALASAPIVKVSGKVIDLPADAKEFGVMVREYREGIPQSGLEAALKKDGSYVVWGLDPGPYSLFVESEEVARSAAVDVDIETSDVEHVDLRFVAPFDVSGQIRFETEPAADDKENQSLHLNLQSSLDDGPSFEADAGADRLFHLEKVTPNRYRVNLGYSAGYVKSWRWGTLQGDGDTVDLRNGPSADPLVLLVSSEMATLSGTVSDSQGPAPGAMVLLEWVQNNESMVTRARPDGTFGFAHLRPGKYRLLAIDGQGDAFPMLFDFEDDFPGQVTEVEIHAGDKLTRDIKKVVPDQ